MTNKPDFCKNCPINHVTEGYVPLCRGTGNDLFVGEAAGEEEIKLGKPFVGGAGTWLNSMLRAARISRESLNIINTIGCRPPDNIYPTDQKWPQAVENHFKKEVSELEKKIAKLEKKEPNSIALVKLRRELEVKRINVSTKVSTLQDGYAGVAYCFKQHLSPALQAKSWSRVVALGDQALRALTGRKGILLWRGSPLPLITNTTPTPKVVPTLHPAYLLRNAGLFSVAVGDLRKRPTTPVEHYTLYPSLETVKAFTSKEFAFDFEWDYNEDITLCGLSDKFNSAIVIPWDGAYIPELRRIFENASVLIGHNIIGADTKHFEKLGWDISRAKLIDTMLIQHLVQPDMRHNLAFVASVFSNKVFWKGSGEEEEDADGNYAPTGAQWRTWDSPNSIPKHLGGYGGCLSADEAYRLYNARDTDASFQCSMPLRSLLQRYEMEHIYNNVSVPAGFICRELADKGLRINTTKVRTIREELEGEIVLLEAKLPEGLKPYEESITKQIDAPPGTYKPRDASCRGSKKDKTQHDKVTVEICTPEGTPCPVCGRLLTLKLAVIKRIKVPATKKIAPWNSSPQVIKYAESIGCAKISHAKTGSPTANKTARRTWGREHTEFTLVDQLKYLSTQAQSFAKPGLLKVDRVYFNLLVHGTSEGRLSSSGRRRGIDPNIQNQPKGIRKIYIPDHNDWCFVCADIVQGENMLTAWLAKDWERWERLHSPGFDEHSYMASQFFNKPYDLVCKGGELAYLRKPGKVINHGRNYGLGVNKTQIYLEEQGFFYNLADIREMIEIWKKVNKRTAQWQNETIETARKQGYLVNPFGRRRWFQSRDYATKALAFLPASTLADTVLRMMIGLYPHRFHDELRTLGIETVGTYPKDWSLRIQVHDELTSQGPIDTWQDAARVVTAVMTQPWRDLGGFKFDVELTQSPISWGDAKVVNI
jgi:DNA polymerase I-like protein with 3'-5' exonuclease and polymerase domains/uracil-DNA glycosylase